MDVVALIVAAGRGQRAGDGLPKQYREVAGRTVLARALEPFLAHPAIGTVLCAIHPDDRPLYDAATAEFAGQTGLRAPVAGGATRQVSVLRALEAVAERGQGRLCLVHDAARMFADRGLIDRAIAAAQRHGAAVPALPVTDTVKRVDAAGRIVHTLDRAELRTVQTPQAFAFDALLAAHRKAAEAGEVDFTDDARLAEWAGVPVHVFEGAPANMKVTTPSDFTEAERRLAPPAAALVTRVATGFDVHVFGPGGHIWLGGVQVPHDRGVVAHSDGDVVLHALTDALLGTLGEGDIGTHFPPSDPQWRGAASDQFLAFAAERVRAAGGCIDHLDATILCERPKVGPYRDAMRQRIAAVAGLPLGAVSIKATTTERLGFTGRGEGIAAQAAATVRLPSGG
ncbi:bifunctional 2-C-methyl-D-erythritol 4-phosphate cytidylyltransferase/2-C-methyl-D-erythritol 2,4-cyclodiphosphate synthase [Enterovirga sp.]|uniref:bifunctional 2-C-methyl-D-erythritol 4-phosphate cytidylyltransferase/2-C-methyl-D-erythritol 2,4-cyclodiphosphate synthase n=1 Tax=Enterovirga sp. TaxID=2026350 RepID=UPI002615BADE|nr:bifunctional 2-C-methyl-D-erythritol 4-phosphate cytidylyltransferase/2-C-methyl-D-erythritol 2,4-cyclodiphosphate synthase [Enterovirga sp.]MDB5591489.1 ispDF [Enterovirga sp.]